jgi:AcrR family transcriptional regulator
MARPSKSLIVRDAVVEAGLRIIDTEGLKAFSLPRLARELNVQAPSLYHHFKDKAEILQAVARVIVLSTRLPDPKSVPNWIEWQVALSLAARQSILRHRNAVPVLMQYMPRDVMINSYDNNATCLREVGVPLDRLVVILDGLDKLTIGGAISEALREFSDVGRPFGAVDATTEPDLAQAVSADPRSSTAVFAETVRRFLRGAAPEVPESAPPPNHWGSLDPIVGNRPWSTK